MVNIKLNLSATSLADFNELLGLLKKPNAKIDKIISKNKATAFIITPEKSIIIKAAFKP